MSALAVLQACHAATAALWESRQGSSTVEYCAPDKLDHMHKVMLNITEQPARVLLSCKQAV